VETENRELVTRLTSASPDDIFLLHLPFEAAKRAFD
jgi:hypothetical protein